MKTMKNIALATCSLLLLTQCATQDEVRNLQYQLRAVNQKLEDVKSKTVNQMQKRQASSVSKIDQVEDETLRIKSSIEENASQTNQFRDQVNQNISNVQSAVDTVRTDNEAKIAELNQEIAVLEEKVVLITENFSKIQQERINEAEKRARAAAQRAEAARQKAKAAQTTAARSLVSSGTGTVGVVKLSPNTKKARVATAAPAATRTSSVQKTADMPREQPATPEKSAQISSNSTSSDPFSLGMKQYKAKKYQEAYRLFEQSLAANPNGSQAAESLYYMGESLYNQGEYDLAILDYQKVISNHSRNPLAPGALLKQGMSFEKLTDHETAKIIYKKLINDHEGSGEAKQAKERLGKL